MLMKSWVLALKQLQLDATIHVYTEVEGKKQILPQYIALALSESYTFIHKFFLQIQVYALHMHDSWKRVRAYLCQ